MVKIEGGRGGRRLAASRRRSSKMASDWSKYVPMPVSRGALNRKGRFLQGVRGDRGDLKDRFLGRATELMYAAQQGDVDTVKKIVKQEVSRALSS